ncbi:MAG: class I SAM-dependent methyltransferase [Actinomycetota bacterium]|nr:class I SAM-dependent methyltransferase [Actinomycetota bacterium]
MGVEVAHLDPPPKDWYSALADHLGEAYLSYEFTQGTKEEVDFLFHALALRPADRLLDVGCGPGRHAIEFARRGVMVVGIDISSRFLNIARKRAEEAGVGVSFFEMDAGELPFEDEFDAVISISQGAFGLGLDDLRILRAMGRSLKPGGHLAAGAANVYHVVTRPYAGTLDPVSALFRQTIREVEGEDGSTKSFDMWNACYTPRELEWLANGCRLDPQYVSGVLPGSYRSERPRFDHPELLLLARKPAPAESL